MRVFPWRSCWFLAVLVLIGVSQASAQQPHEPAKLSHAVPAKGPSPAETLQGLFTSDQDRIYAARQRVARASYVASKIQAGEVQPVDYSVLESVGGPEVVHEEVVRYGSMHPGAGPEMIVSEHGGRSCDSCTGDGCNACGDVFCFPLCFELPLDNLSLRAGAQGFKGPLNGGMDGSFGFLYGLNWGAPVALARNSGIGAQIGFNASHANLYEASYTDHTRDQWFFTTGLFRRVDWGWQGGVVFDHMSDQWYYDIKASQIRGELSWKFKTQGEFGFWFTSSGHTSNVRGSVMLPGESTPTAIDEDFRPQNLYAFFYRTPLDICGGEMRLSAGWSGDEKGLLGADLNIPISQHWAVESNFLFLLPDAQGDTTRNQHETWNIGLNLVWYPRAHAGSAGKSYYRPLFNVADNGTFSMRPK